FLTILFAFLFFALTFYLRNTVGSLSSPFVIVFLGTVALSLIVHRWEVLILIVLICTSTVFEMLEFPTIPIAIGDLFYTDILLFLLILSRIVRRVTENVVIIPKPMGYPILASILVGIFSFIYATVGLNVSTTLAGIELRPIIYLALFFVVVYAIKTLRQLNTLLLGIMITSVIVAALLAVQHLIGTETSIIAGRVEMLRTAEKRYSDLTRVLIPGSSMVFFALIACIAIFVLKGLKRRARNLLLLVIATLCLGLILTFTRVFWIMVFAATVLMLIIARRQKIVYPRMTMLIVIAGLVLTLVIQTNSLNSAVIKEAVLRRSASILSATERFREDTLFVRYLESRYAWQKIVENPLLGIGLGNQYRPVIFGNVYYEKISKGTQLHNGYFATQLKMGLLGTIVFLWLIGAFLHRFFKRWKLIKDPLYQSVALGVAVCVGGMLISNLISSPFLAIHWVAVFSVSMGVVEKIYQFEDIS
ncbi:MAG: O-antigen ligase family protein, partial [bacterium]